MKSKRLFLISLFIVSLSMLPSCTKSDRKNTKSDIVFCYLSNTYIDSNMKNWHCYSDVISYSGYVEEDAVGHRYVYPDSIDRDFDLEGRLYSFTSSSAIIGGSFGIGYTNSKGVDEIALSTPIVSKKDYKVFSLSVNTNYTKIEENTGWTNVEMSTRTFALLIFSHFNPDESGSYGYSSYEILDRTFIRYLTDYSEENARKVTWEKNGTTINFYDELQRMKNNYKSNVKKNYSFDVLFYLIGFLLTSVFLVIIGLFILRYVKERKYKN